MDNLFFDHPILNSPYEYPTRHWELDEPGQPTQKIVNARRPEQFITPIPKLKKRKGRPKQDNLLFVDLSTQIQQYSHTTIINGIRREGGGQEAVSALLGGMNQTRIAVLIEDGFPKVFSQIGGDQALQ